MLILIWDYYYYLPPTDYNVQPAIVIYEQCEAEGVNDT